MRPYRLRIRLSSRRLNVTRFGGGVAAAARATARFSLGSVSSDVELMERLLSSQACSRSENRSPLFGARRGSHDCANRRTPQGGANTKETARMPRPAGNIDSRDR